MLPDDGPVRPETLEFYNIIAVLIKFLLLVSIVITCPVCYLYLAFFLLHCFICTFSHCPIALTLPQQFFLLAQYSCHLNKLSLYSIMQPFHPGFYSFSTALKVEASNFSDMSVTSYQSTLHLMSEDCSLQKQRTLCTTVDVSLQSVSHYFVTSTHFP